MGLNVLLSPMGKRRPGVSAQLDISQGGEGGKGETRIDCDEDVVDGRIGGNEQFDRLRTCRVARGVRASVWAGPNVLLSV